MDYQLISLFFLIFFSFVFLYFDFKYQKIPNFLSFTSIGIFLILAYLTGFFQEYIWIFLFRSLLIFIVFYFLYLQGRVAGGDFKLYFALTGFLILFLYTQGNIVINWMYFDMYIVMYSLIVGFFYLVLRYIFLWIKTGFKFQIDPIIKQKISNDRKDALIHFILLSRSIIYLILIEILLYFSNNFIIPFLVILLEFVFIGYVFMFLREKIFLTFDWFIRKKEVKWFSILFFIFTALYLIYLKHYSLVFLLIIFTFLEYIVAVLQLNYDTKIISLNDLKYGDKLSIRNFPIQLSKEFSLLEEIEADDDMIDYFKKNKTKNVEIVTEIPYGVFLVIGIVYMLIKMLM